MSHTESSHYSLSIRAGASAFRELREHGWAPSRIGALAGASGGAKWLVLSQLDRVVVSSLLPQFEAPVHTIATSIGAWRFSCYGQNDPLAAIQRFEDGYLGQTYSDNPDRAEISARTREILDYVLGDNGAREILSHPLLRTHVMAVRARGLLASENTLPLAVGLLSMAAMNVVNRRSLGLAFDRVLFHDTRSESPFKELDGFPMYCVPMTEQNYRDTVLATGAIPLVLEGVSDIAGAPRGMYRDGGVIDYHLDFPHSESDKLALFVHFYDHLKPGWFDKRLDWRRAAPTSVDRTILVSPSPQFVSKLPNAKIPDRRDFQTMTPAERVKAWTSTVAACRELADEFHELIESGRIAERVQPMV